MNVYVCECQWMKDKISYNSIYNLISNEFIISVNVACYVGKHPQIAVQLLAKKMFKKKSS